MLAQALEGVFCPALKELFDLLLPEYLFTTAVRIKRVLHKSKHESGEKRQSVSILQPRTGEEHDQLSLQDAVKDSATNVLVNKYKIRLEAAFSLTYMLASVVSETGHVKPDMTL